MLVEIKSTPTFNQRLIYFKALSEEHSGKSFVIYAGYNEIYGEDIDVLNFSGAHKSIS